MSNRLLPLANWLPAARLALALATARYPGCLDPLTPPVALVFQCCFGCYSRVGKRKAPLPSPPAIPRPAHQRCARGLAPSCEPGHTRFASPPPSQLALPAPLVPLTAPLRPTLPTDVGERGTTSLPLHCISGKKLFGGFGLRPVSLAKHTHPTPPSSPSADTGPEVDPGWPTAIQPTPRRGLGLKFSTSF